MRQFVVDNFLFGQPDDRLTDESSLLSLGIVDSTGVLELIGFLESRYGLVVLDDEIVPGNLDSVARVAAFVEFKRRQSRVVEPD